MESKDTLLPGTDELAPAPSTENQESSTITLTKEVQEAEEPQETEETQETQETEETQETPSEAEETTPLSTEKGVETETHWHLPACSEDISEDDYQAASAMISTIEREIATGAISNETMALLLKSVAYDRSVAIAHHEGEVAGRNQRIDEYMQERRKEKELPDLGRSPIQPRPTLPYTMIGGLSAADRKSIWERGNEKRLRI